MVYFHSFFAFTSGIQEPIRVPTGTCKNIVKHITEITEGCGLEVIRTEGNPPHWDRYEPNTTVDNTAASSLVMKHNTWVEWLYNRIEAWAANPPVESEDLTQEFAAEWYYGFYKLRLPVARWSADYYHQEMQRLFDVMCGGQDDETTWEADPLTPRQAADVICLFSTYLDKHDIRLELPHGWDSTLLTPDDYLWCPEHGAIAYDDAIEPDDENDDYRCPECDNVVE